MPKNPHPPESATLSRLAQSLALVESRRTALVEAAQRRLAELEGEDEAFGQADVTGLALTDLLIACARDLVAGRPFDGANRHARELRRLEIDGRHLSRFGVLIQPAMREAFGALVSPAIAAAWCDAFWHAVREVMKAPAAAEPAPRAAARA